jgi:hypothetical protein
MTKRARISAVAIALLVPGGLYLAARPASALGALAGKTSAGTVDKALAARFEYLSKNGNSTCSVAFRNSIFSMPDAARLRGSCCSPMSQPRYVRQIKELRKFKSVRGQNVAEIPDDPYDIEAGLAKKLMSDCDLTLTPKQQKAYDYAMQHSEEKGPCCCRCWRWTTFGGLAKYLIRNHHFTGRQIVAVWNLMDGCGGAGEEHR